MKVIEDFFYSCMLGSCRRLGFEKIVTYRWPNISFAENQPVVGWLGGQ
jgi:hypothetical protein